MFNVSLIHAHVGRGNRVVACVSWGACGPWEPWAPWGLWNAWEPWVIHGGDYSLWRTASSLHEAPWEPWMPWVQFTELLSLCVKDSIGFRKFLWIQGLGII